MTKMLDINTILPHVELYNRFQALQNHYLEKLSTPFAIQETEKRLGEIDVQKVISGELYEKDITELKCAVEVLKWLDLADRYVAILEIEALHSYLKLFEQNQGSEQSNTLSVFRAIQVRIFQSTILVSLPIRAKNDYIGPINNHFDLLKSMLLHFQLSDPTVAFLNGRDFENDKNALSILATYLSPEMKTIVITQFSSVHRIRNGKLRARITHYLKKWISLLIGPEKIELIKDGIPIHSAEIIQEISNSQKIIRSHFVPVSYLTRISKSDKEHFMIKDNHKKMFTFKSTSSVYAKRYIYGNISVEPSANSL